MDGYRNLYGNNDILINMRFDTGTVNDLAGNIWTNNGVTFIEDGKFNGKCAYFNGNSALTASPINLSLTNDFTISFWANTTSFIAGSPNVVFAGIGSSIQLYDNLTNPRAVSMTRPKSLRYARFVNDNGAYKADKLWHHCAIIRNNGMVMIYIDGVKCSQVNNSDIFDFSGCPMAIGTNPGYATVYLSGTKIDDFVIIKGTALWTNDFIVPYTYLTDMQDYMCLYKNDIGSIYMNKP